jgi:hypothetical protein
MFSVFAILMAAIHLTLFLYMFNLEESFTGLVLPLFVITHSAKFMANQSIWGRCFMQVVEVTLDPYDVIR